MNPTRTTGKRRKFGIGLHSIHRVSRSLSSTRIYQRHLAIRHKDVNRFIRTCSGMMPCGRSARSNLKKRATWLIKVIVDTKNDKVYSSSSTSSSLRAGSNFVSYQRPYSCKPMHFSFDRLDLISTGCQQRNLQMHIRRWSAFLPVPSIKLLRPTHVLLTAV